MDVLVERNRTLLKEGILSDITFIVGGKDKSERIKAHKGILSAANSVFYLILTKATEDETEIRLPDIDPSTFKILIEFIYTNEDPKIDSENWALLLHASEKFRIPSLRKMCKSFVENCIWSVNPFKLFSQARKYGVQHHVPFLKEIIAFYANKSLASDSILDIQDTESLREILSYDRLNCDEIVVFRAAIRWASAQSRENHSSLREILGQTFYSIRFPIIGPNEFRNEVISRNILTDEEIINILKKNDSVAFQTNSRIRLCCRLNEQKICTSSTLRTKHHAIKFKVDHPVKIHGLSIHVPHDEERICSGRILLKAEEGKVLGDKSFEIHSNKVFSTTVVHFEEAPIFVDSNEWYIASVDYFDISTDSTIIMGNNGRSTVTIDGVEWMFDSVSSSKETNVSRGQIPAIEFSK